ncbi:MAG: penicillin acylase family protein, partial [Acidimicrobiia bacterium]
RKILAAEIAVADSRAVLEMHSPPRPGFPVMVPPRGTVIDDSLPDAIMAARADIATLAANGYPTMDESGGSNAWAIAGWRSASGAALLFADSHRVVEQPTTYYPVTLSCDAFHISGLLLAGVPLFSSFGENGRVAWAITNASADAQDVYVERFRTADGALQVLHGDTWRPAEVTTETIWVRDGDAIDIERCRTRHGPVVHGDPRSGTALTLRWTVHLAARNDLGIARAMLDASSSDELLDLQAGWIDPVNNLIVADAGGNVGYMLRGKLPRRSDVQGRALPRPGWFADEPWDELVDVGSATRVTDPPDGYVFTTNNTVSAEPDVDVSQDIADWYRAVRLTELLDAGSPAFEDCQRMQTDVVSVAMRHWAQLLAMRRLEDANARLAAAAIIGADGSLEHRPGATVYVCLLRRVAAALIDAHHPSIGWILDDTASNSAGLIRRWLAQLSWPSSREGLINLDQQTDAWWSARLAEAWTDHLALPSDDWSKLRAQHSPIVGTAQMGDGETLNVATYPVAVGAGFPITIGVALRFAVELDSGGKRGWAIPGGTAETEFDSPLLEAWRDGALCPFDAGPSPY